MPLMQENMNDRLWADWFIPGFTLLLLAMTLSSAYAMDIITVEYSGEEYELTASCFLTGDNSLVLQLPTIHATEEDQTIYAEELAKQGQSACLMHIFSDLFMSPENSSLDKLPLEGIWNLILETYRITDKTIFMATYGRGARVAMRTLQRAPDTRTVSGGIIMFSPNLLDGVPDAGVEHQFINEITINTVPIYIFQPVYSPHYWHMETLKTQFDNAGTVTYFHKLDNVRDGYPFREDQTNKEFVLRQRTGKLLQNAIKTLNAQ